MLSNRQIVFHENDPPAFKRIGKLETDILQNTIWFLEEHEVWVTGGVDFNLRFWKIDSAGKVKMTCMFSAHMKDITKVLDIHAPKLIASSSLDGKIKLWDYMDKALITELKDPSSNIRGVRGMVYSYEFGGNLLSYGFDNFVNVWCPEVSLSRPYVGKLEGHSSIVIGCKYLIGSPIVITIDDKSNIRIWDIRTLSSIQVIAADKLFN